MRSSLSLLSGMGLGASLMYFLDPDRGKRRRAMIRDQIGHLAHQTSTGLDKSSRDLSQRIHGMLAELRSLPSRDQVSDDVLVARVRAKIGRVTSHPSAIEVTASDGRIQVSGPILANEVDRLLDCIHSVHGVREVDNHLEVHERPQNIPGLQTGGTQPRARQRQEPLWPPALRLFAITGGGGLIVFGLVCRGISGSAAGMLGTGLLARGITNMSLRRLIGIGSGQPVLALQKTMNIHAPVEPVFTLWSHYETFPRFMTHIREVKRLDNNRSTWAITGPLGTTIRWEALVTKEVPNELISWVTLPGSAVAQRGTVRFESNAGGETRLDLKLWYTPPAGMLGQMIATLLGAAPKRLIDEDLVRFKSLCEHGRTSAHGTEVIRDELIEHISRTSSESILSGH